MTAEDASRDAAKRRLQDRIARERRVALIVNTRSRRGQNTFAEAKRLLAERGMALSLRTLTRLASSDLLDRLGIREGAERLLHNATKTGARTAAQAGRAVRRSSRVRRRAGPGR